MYNIVCYYTLLYRKESKIITQGSLVYACNYSLSFITLGILSFAVFSTHAGLGNVLTPKKVFSTLTMLFFIRLYFLQFVLYCLLHISEMSVAVKRIQVIMIVNTCFSEKSCQIFNVCNDSVTNPAKINQVDTIYIRNTSTILNVPFSTSKSST